MLMLLLQMLAISTSLVVDDVGDCDISPTGDSGSPVYGNLAHGVFDGTVETPDEIYHIEPANRYAEHLGPNNTFHSIIYRQSDLGNYPLAVAMCGSSHSTLHKDMLQLQRSALPVAKEHAKVLNKRQARDPLKVRCWLNVTVDNKLVNDYNSIGQNPTASILNIVMRASSIFSRTDFNNDGSTDNIQFGIKTLAIENSSPSGTIFANDFIGVSAFLDAHSTFDYSDFCLAYRFTYRDFQDGVVGLAYVAPQVAAEAAGGICEGFRTFRTGVQQTLNTGIVTTLNYGRRVASPLTALTFAHEAGHNFGSTHDMGDVPADGAFIMYAFAADGSQPNNDEFSPASRALMNTVIAERGQGTDGCFVEATNLCGNNLVDAENEECDCGNDLREDGICMSNPCCNGRNCTLASNILCSPDQGVCCNTSCMFIPASDNVTCSQETDCAERQICGYPNYQHTRLCLKVYCVAFGSSHLCPVMDAKMAPEDPGYILCDMDQAICDGPMCNGTICFALNLTNCECATKNESCHVCCELNGVCTSTIFIAAQNIEGLKDSLPGAKGRNIQVGRPCSNFTGFCDFLSICTPVDEDGAILRLGDLLFNSELFRRTLDFISDKWWVVLLAALGLLFCMFMVVVLFHVFLPRAEIVQSHPRQMSIKYKKRRARGHPSPSAPPQNYPNQY